MKLVVRWLTVAGACFIAGCGGGSGSRVGSGEPAAAVAGPTNTEGVIAAADDDRLFTIDPERQSDEVRGWGLRGAESWSAGADFQPCDIRRAAEVVVIRSCSVDELRLNAFNPETGSRVWSAGPFMSGRLLATLDIDRVYVLSSLDDAEEVISIDLATGRITSPKTIALTNTSQTQGDENVELKPSTGTTSDRAVGGSGNVTWVASDGFVHSYDLVAMKNLWAVDVGAESLLSAHDRGIVAVNSATGLTHLDARSGKKTWSSPVSLRDSESENTEAIPGLLFVQHSNGRVNVIDLNSGSTLDLDGRSFESAAMAGEPLEIDVLSSVVNLGEVDGNKLFGVHFGGLTGRDARTGRELWVVAGVDVGTCTRSDKQPVYCISEDRRRVLQVEPQSGRIMSDDLMSDVVVRLVPGASGVVAMLSRDPEPGKLVAFI